MDFITIIQRHFPKATNSLKENRRGTPQWQEMNCVFPRENEINIGFLSACSSFASTLGGGARICARTPMPSTNACRKADSHQLVFNVMNPTCQPYDSWAWAERVVKPAFLRSGNRLQCLDSFHVQSQPALLDMKENSGNFLALQQAQGEF